MRGTSFTYPRELDEDLRLRGRRRLRLRALRRCEEAPIRNLYAQLSPHSRYQRFFAAAPVAPDPLVRSLASVDYQRTLALVVEEVGGDVVAFANFGAVDERTAELGLVVRDDWQRRRLGTIAAESLLRAAEARGFNRFLATLLPDNPGIRRLLARVGTIVSTRYSGGIVEVEFVRRGALAGVAS